MMKILLIQPAQERGLGFRRLAVVEPLGLESVAGTVPEHKVKILDLRFENCLPETLKAFQPDFCGINGSFTIDVYQTQEITATILRNTFSVSHLLNMKRAAWDPVEPLSYLAGHEREAAS